MIPAYVCVTGFSLIHSSNFSTLRGCNPACGWATALIKLIICEDFPIFGLICVCRFQLSTLIIMVHQSCKIGCMYRISLGLLANPVTYYKVMTDEHTVLIMKSQYNMIEDQYTLIEHPA